ncbi:MAG: hypothetical protein VB858_14930 [Planctomycetaceae bacterium]
MKGDSVFRIPEDNRFHDDSPEVVDGRDAWFQSTPDSDGKSSCSHHWGWALALSLAWLLFELSTDPVISVMVASIGLGGNHFLLSLWLLRRDPNRRRGRACAVFYLAAGFWRITVVTFALIVAASLITLMLDQGLRKQDELIWGVAGRIVFLSFILSGSTTCLATILAVRQDLRVWLDSKVRSCRQKRQWPPRSSGPNEIRRVFTTTMFLLVIIEVCTGFGIVLGLIVPHAGGWTAALLGISTLLIITVAAATLLGGHEWALKKLKAETPQECWPDEE